MRVWLAAYNNALVATQDIAVANLISALGLGACARLRRSAFRP